MAQTPAEHQQRDTTKRHTEHAKFNRDIGILGSVFQQKRNAEKQHDRADFDHHIAGGEIIFDEPERAVFERYAALAAA